MRGVPRPVVAINSRGEVVASYDSISEAARINGSHASNIAHALRNHTYHRKHLWMNRDEYVKYLMEGRTQELANSYKSWKTEVGKRRYAGTSEESKKRRSEKISAARKAYIARNPGSMCKRSRRIYCLTTGETFESGKAFADKYGTSVSNTCHAARKGIRVKGMYVKFLDVNINGKN